MLNHASQDSKAFANTRDFIEHFQETGGAGKTYGQDSENKKDNEVRETAYLTFENAMFGWTGTGQ